MDNPINPTEDHLPRSSGSITDRRLGLILLILLVAFVAVAVIGVVSRLHRSAALRKETEALNGAYVTVVHPEKIPTNSTISLPGETSAFSQAPIYAQTGGYLKKWNFDIGARVKEGDVLAEIDTPEIDQQIQQAEATLKEAQANLWLAETTKKREDDLMKKDVISRQDFDNQSSDLKSKQAAVVADEANVRKLQATKSFSFVRAPFDGILSARNTDIGALVTPATSGTPLFTVAQISPLRVYVNVPEKFASAIKPGAPSTLTFDSYPGRSFSAVVVTTSGTIDPSSRTLLTELIISNKSGELFPGAYVNVEFSIPTNFQNIQVPENVLLFRKEGASVALVNADGRVSIKKIRIDQDLGTKLEVEGLSLEDQLILNPSDSVNTGDKVEISKKPVN